MQSEEQDYKSRKVQMKAEDVQGRNVIMNFHGMSLTTDKLRSLLQKWCTLIESTCEVKTSDGYTLRVFAIAFTRKLKSQVCLFPSILLFELSEPCHISTHLPTQPPTRTHR